ncbi:MAG: adenylate/guanylate cyclase domain-containing protein [Rhodospirillales bacterium]|jgi:adenylate cyclase|nr:adenylate/guanylate cyclase domain-containing protein [Rhodospirillales bacterium]
MKNISAYVFGKRLEAEVPERTRRDIADQQIESESLIGWVQLTLVGVLAALYIFSPKTSAGTSFQPVPWALGAYLSFTVMRIFLAYRRFLPRSLLMISVVMDMGLLMGLIWSFHLQYEQPAPFYLKAPTMLYVFIFISLRALRFEAKYVVAAGVAAAGGWLMLLLYALAGMEGMDAITRDYVRYMTSNSVLIGAEIDKVISILMVTAVLAVALVRAQRLLNRSVVDSAAAHDLSRFVAPEVADRITTAHEEVQAGDGEVKQASVLFTDIEGFSTTSEKLGPKALIGALNEYFAALCQVIDRHGGVITQFEGDAMLISFNTAKPDPDHAANAVGTAIGIQAAVAGRTFGGAVMKTRCGLSTGELVFGAVGAKDRLLFTVHGDEVNVAARLEQLNKTYGTYVMASEATVCQAGGDFGFERIDEVTVRGRETPTVVYAIRDAWAAGQH